MGLVFGDYLRACPMEPTNRKSMNTGHNMRAMFILSENLIAVLLFEKCSQLHHLLFSKTFYSDNLSIF